MNTKLSLSVILIFTTFLSCSRKSSLLDSYYEYQNVILDKAETNESGYLKITTFEDYYGEISEQEKAYLLNVELDSLKASKITGIGMAGPAILNDTLGIKQRYCGTEDFNDGTVPKSFAKRNFAYSRVFRRQRLIPLTFHIVSNRNSFEINDALVKTQVEILNEAFSEIDIVFYIHDIKRYVNSKWYKAYVDTPEFEEMLDNTINMPINSINIYSTNQDSLYGQAIFPWDKKKNTKFDYILLNENTFPGLKVGDELFLGKTLIHEMGHYFGLYHTFHMEQYDENNNKIYNACNDETHDGCSNDLDDKYKGDLIEDTPAQKICHFYKCNHCGVDDCGTCDSCPQLIGNDPVKNYMGYNPDTCMDHFTEGQYQMMVNWLFTEHDAYIQELAL